MKKIELGLLILTCLGASSSFSKDNIFAPKNSGISNSDINVIVEERLNDQKFEMENDFSKKIKDFKKNISEEQNNKFNNIFTSIEELKRENEDLKRKNKSRIIYKDSDTYSEDDVTKELSYLLDDSESIEDDSFILTEDIIRLNEEYGEESLIFVAMIDEHKIYKNKDGEYIVKGMDFDYSDFKAKQKIEKERQDALKESESKPPRRRK